MENAIVIKNREELILLLSEAATLEHMLMCEYLFAAFSLKTGPDQGLTAAQSEAVARWERTVSAVAVQEMLHLALANNMLASLGAAPYFNRPNFPQQARYFPEGVQLALLPFGERALRHFLYLERPEGMSLQDAAGFEARAAASTSAVSDDDQVVPEAQDFATVGHLYRGIEQGFAHLVEKYGESSVFVGPAKVQASASYFGWPELVTVTDLASATKAIETIVEEGEGARGDWTNAHYGKFLAVFDEYMQFKAQDPYFEPARPATAAFVRIPNDVDEAPLIADPLTAGVADLFNAAYEVMLQLLIRFFVHQEETDTELQALTTTAVNTMFTAIKPLGQLLTTLPLGPHLPNQTAGPTFEVYRTGYYLPHHDAAWAVLRERLQELAAFARELAARPGAPAALAPLEGAFQALAAGL